MPLPDPLATVYIVYGSDLKGPFVAVLHYFQVGTFTIDQAAAESLAEVVDNGPGANLKDCISADCEYTETVAYINTGGVVYSARSNTSAAVGNISGQSMPDYAAAVIQKRTMVGGKTGRGRWYLGCCPEEFNDTGKLNSSAHVNYDTWGASAISDAVAATGTWRAGHLSRKDDTCVRITSWVTAPNFGTRRKRRLRSLGF